MLLRSFSKIPTFPDTLTVIRALHAKASWTLTDCNATEVLFKGFLSLGTGDICRNFDIIGTQNTAAKDDFVFDP
jgi:hypothetical protein